MNFKNETNICLINAGEMASTTTAGKKEKLFHGEQI
jgi:hypothetical protein